MRKKSIEGFVELFVHSDITIIDDIIWKTTLFKKLKKESSFQGEKKKSLDSLLYDSNNTNDKLHSPRFTIERTASNNLVYTTNTVRSVPKQGQVRPYCHS